MYFTIGWPQTLNGCEDVQSIIPNSDHSIFLFLSRDTLSLWYCRPVVQLLKYKRRPDSLEEYGDNVSAVWKSDSSQIVVQTSRDTLLFYTLVYAEDSNSVLNTNESSHKSDYPVEPSIPSLVLTLHTRIQIRDGVTCLMAAEEAVVIANRNSRNTIEICGLEWEGRLDPNFHLSVSVPNTSKPSVSGAKDQSFTVCDIKFSTIIGGFSLVLSNNIGGFLPLGDTQSSGHQLQVISGVDSPKCTAINHKYALIAYGLESSDGVICQYDDIDCRFFITHRLVLPPNSHGDINKSLGPMNCLQWSPDLTVLVTSWQNGGFAIWTVFGSLLSCSLSWNCSSISPSISPFVVTSIAFGKEGYHLYLATKTSSSFIPSDNDNAQSPATDMEDQAGNHSQNNNQFNTVYKLSLARSVLAANPSSSVTAETVLLASEDKLYVGGNKNLSLFTQYTVDEKESLPNGLTNLILSEQESNVDSFQWLTVPMNQYLDLNWPIRFFAIDPVASQNLAVAGATGFAVYSMLNRKWKMFNYENHERDFVVTGGFLWYNHFLICGCMNQTKADGFEIRAYSTRTRLDNAFAKIISVESEVVSLSLHQSRLLALCSNGAIFLYDLHQIQRPTHGRDMQEYELNISAPIKVTLTNFHVIPDCVTMCLLTDLHVDMYHSFINSDTITGPYATHSRKRGQAIQIAAVAKSLSILLNIFGKVYLCEIDIDTTTLPLSSEDEDDDHVEPIAARAGSDSISNSARTSLVDDDDVDDERLSLKSSDSVNIESMERDSHQATIDKKRTRTISQSTEPINLIRYKKTTTLASNVESLWILPHEQNQLNAFRSGSSSVGNVQMKPHLETSLYLNCGSQGMAVWLSLEHSMIRKSGSRNANGNNSPFHHSSETEHAYISKRIMLPLNEISSHIYPLAVRFRDVIVLGAEADFAEYSSKMNVSSRENDPNGFEALHSLPFCVIKRTSQVYLHYILRELLRRNLGYRAWEIANTCTALPHFVHSLELLLHGVLEEEAGSSAVIPDPMLPRVVEFIRAFPVFLQTVIHCARKTELALWPHLFSVVGSPKDLFHQCIAEGQLETASSYIIVLQNLEKPEVATKCISKLLQAARMAGSWSTIKELKRFVRATQEPEQHPLKSRTESVSSTTNETPNIPISNSPTSQEDRDKTASPQKTPSEHVLSRSSSVNSDAKSHHEMEIEQDVLMKVEDESTLKAPEQDTVSMEELPSMEPEIERIQLDLETVPSAGEHPPLLSPSLSVSSISSGAVGFGTARAYPGSIKLMGSLTHESIHLNGAPFHFLAASSQRQQQQQRTDALLGTCSISSINSISSVASSSMSLSNSSTSSSPAAVIRPQPTVAESGQPKFSQVIVPNGTHIKDSLAETPVRTVIKSPRISESDTDNTNQCVIS